MAQFDEEQIRQIVREEQRPSTNWGRVLFWFGVVIITIMILIYLASETLTPA
jgi:hypothetical protein